MQIRKFEVGPFLENTYVISKDEKCLIIDPGFSRENEFISFKDFLESNTLTPIAVVLTHAHVDHILGLQRLLKDFQIPVYLNTEDLFLWENFGSQATMFGLNQVGFSFIPEALPTEGKFIIDIFEFECVFTPGHSPDHTSLYFEEEGFILAGDALFWESIGRTDLYKGNFELLEQSILNKLYVLPQDTKVYPGHGPETTIGHEKKFNPFVKG